MRQIVTLAVILLIVVMRVWWWASPLQVPSGTRIKLRVTTGRLTSYRGMSGFVYKGMAVPVPSGVNLKAGDEVRVTGEVVDRKDGPEKILRPDSFEVVENGTGFGGAAKSANLRLREMILSWLPGDAGALAAGMLLGGDAGMSAEGRATFRSSGLSHVMAASGYNVTVAAGVVMFGLAKWLGRRLAIPFGIVCVVLYVILAGGTGAVVRAGAMVSLTLLGKYLGRPIDAVWMLFLSGWGMVMIRPEWAFDVGFQLSVAATAGLLMAGGDPGEAGWRSNLRMSVAASMMTIPILLYYFGNVSVWAPIVNVVVLWCVPWIMEITLAAVAVGLVVGSVGQVVSYLAWPLLKWMIIVAGWAADWPGNGWQVGRMGVLWVAGYYLLICGFWLMLKRRKRGWGGG